MHDVATIALTAILSLARPPAVDVVAERPRLVALAEDIAAVVEERDALAQWLPGAVLPLPVQGDAAAVGAALMLVAVAAHESGFRAEVSDCQVVGADHPSITAFQLLGWFARGPYSKSELCASPRRAAERALFVLAHHAARCDTPAATFRGYASGDCSRQTAAATRQCKIWERLLASAALRGSCSSRSVARLDGTTP